MKKYIYILLFTFLFVTNLKAQFSLEYSVGYGSYEMSDFKSIINNGFSNMQNQFPQIPFRILDNFPGKLTHNFSLGYTFENHEIGVRASYMTTGGKLAYADYSGEYMEKLTANAYRLSGFYRYYIPLGLKNTSNFYLFGELSPGITFSKMKYEGHIRIGDESQIFPDDIGGNTTGFTLSPLIGIKYNIFPQVGLIANSGYDFTFGSSLSKTMGSKIDWSGFRANCGVFFIFQ